MKILLLLLVLLFVAPVYALDVSVDVPSKYRVVHPGDDLQFQVTVKDIAVVRRHDISLTYTLKDGEQVISTSRELKAIETQASFLSQLAIPPSISPGSYTLQVTINDKERAESTVVVEEEASAIGSLKAYLLMLTIVILFVGAIIWWELHKLRLGQLHKKRMFVLG